MKSQLMRCPADSLASGIFPGRRKQILIREADRHPVLGGPKIKDVRHLNVRRNHSSGAHPVGCHAFGRFDQVTIRLYDHRVARPAEIQHGEPTRSSPPPSAGDDVTMERPADTDNPTPGYRHGEVALHADYIAPVFSCSTA